MRAFCFIFSLYALTLALTPCADGFCGGDEQHQSSAAHEDEKTDDLCSSFCICACSGYSAIELNSLQSRLGVAMAATAKPSSFYKAPHITAFSIDFWQPPKLG